MSIPSLNSGPLPIQSCSSDLVFIYNHNTVDYQFLFYDVWRVFHLVNNGLDVCR